MKQKVPVKYQIWIDARKKHKLSDTQVQMAMELGLNPKKFGSLDNHKQEPWKLPLSEFIEELYYKHFSKMQPDIIKSIEQIVKEINHQSQK